MSRALHFLCTGPLPLGHAPLLRSWLRVPSTLSTSGPVTLACASAWSTRALSRHSATSPAATTKKTRGRKKKTAASVATTPSMSASSSSDVAYASTAPLPTRERKRRDAAPSASPAAGTTPSTFDDAAMVENDVRLAMRTLMTIHLSRQSHLQRRGNEQRTREREEFREKHDERERRLLEKDANSMRLLGEDGRSLGDGIVPFVPTSAQNPYQETTGLRGGAAAAAGGVGVWRSLNPVGLAASQAVAAQVSEDSEDALSEEDYAAFLASSTAASAAARATSAAPHGTLTGLDDWKSATLATLCAPNLSMYDTDHDFRVRSEDVVQKAEETGRAAAAAAAKGSRWAAAQSPSSAHPTRRTFFASGDAAATEEEEGEEELAADLPATTAALLRQQFAEEEDPDYAVSVYTVGGDEDSGPLQL